MGGKVRPGLKKSCVLADAIAMKYVVVAEGRVVYCETRAEAVRIAYLSRGRVFRADWTEVDGS